MEKNENDFSSSESIDTQSQRFKEDIPQGLDEIRKFFQYIKDGNFEEVKEFSTKFTGQKLCYDDKNVCALEYAIDCGQFKVYSFLRANGFYTDRGKELDERLSKLSMTQRREIRLENLKYVKDFPDAFIGVLISKCKFDACSPVSSSEVHEMLTELSRVPELRPFLEIAAQVNFKVIFDFTSASVKNMVPGYNESVFGLSYYVRGELYVGAYREKYLRYGTFMHELSHLVFNAIYDNNALPYCREDKQREKEWSELVISEREKYQKNPENAEEIIKWAFDGYSPGPNQELELAVRPNHIMARYLENPEKVEELRLTYSKVFDYLESVILPDIQIPNVFRYLKLNKEFKVIRDEATKIFRLIPSNEIEILTDLQKSFVLTSNVPKIAMLKLFNDMKIIYKNVIEAKVKNIFVNIEKVQERALKDELFDLVENFGVDRVILDVSDAKNVAKALKLLEELPKDLQVILVCSDESSKSFEFDKVFKTFTFDDLNAWGQMKVLEKEIRFQGKVYKASDFFWESQSNEIFGVLCDEKEILINCKMQKFESYFIPRTIQCSNEELSVDQFLQKVQKEKTVIFSNIAGSGKTTMLKKIHEIFHEEFPEHWISFVSLLDHVDELSQISDENFEQKFRKILKMSKIEEKVFTQKFEKGEVKILFDGFDEISPKCKSQTLKLFKLFNAQSKNQIWITTRTHLELELEGSLKVKSHKLKILPESDQIKFLCNFWKNSNRNQNFIEKCAQDLVQKISEFVKDHPNLIGIPIIIQSVAKLYENKIDENFPNEIKNLKLSDVYKKILEDALNILASRFPEKWIKNAFKRSSILQALEFLTISHYFGENHANSLGLSHNESDFPLEELCRSGLLALDENGKVKFNHETYGEFFLSTVIEYILENFNEPSDPQIKLLIKILIEEKFKLTKMFFNEIAADIKCKSAKLFKSEISLELFNFVEVENFTNIFYFLMKSNLSEYPKFEKKIEEALRKVSETFEKMEISENFFEEVQKYFENNFYNKFITKAKTDGLTNLENLIKNLKEKNLVKILMHQNEDGETILHKTVCNFEKFQKILISLRQDVGKKYQKKLIQVKNEKGQNVLMASTWKNENSLKFLLEFVESLMDKKEIENLLSEVDEDGDNILHIALLNLKSTETFEFLWHKISKNVQNPKDFLMQEGQYDRNTLQIASQNENCPEIFSSLFDLATSFCQSEEERKNLILEKNAGNENLLTLSAYLAPKPNLKFLIERIIEIFGKVEAKKVLKSTKGEFDRNLFSLAAINDKSKDSIEFLWKVFEENLSREEIFELLDEKDEEGDNVLHLAAAFAKSKEIFEFVWIKIFENFKKNEEKLEIFLKLKRFMGRNFLLLSIAKTNENSFFYTFENILEKFFVFKDFIYECDDNGENFLHQLARFGSVSMLEFAFKKLEEKLSVKELKSFLMMRSKNYRNNLLHCAALQNPNLSAIKLLVAKIEKILDRNELRVLLNQKEAIADSFPLHASIEFNTSEIFEYFTKLYVKYFTKIEIKKILATQGFREMANENEKDKNVKEKVENFYKTLCEPEQ